MNIGELISYRRKKLELTQEELAHRIHVSKSAIGKWESGRGIPDRKNIVKLAEILGISIEDLFFAITGQRPQKIEDINITIDVLEIFNSYGYEIVKKSEVDVLG